MSVLTSLLNKTFEIWLPQTTSDGQGGHTETWWDAGTIAGRMRPANSNERVVAEQEEQQITHVLYTATLETSDGETLGRGALVVLDDLSVEVLGVRNPSLMAHHYEIDCLERQANVDEEPGS
jgi:SPP1 family predicted phage head-tail adaptor